MRFEEKTPDLLALLTSHAGGSSLAMLVLTRHPTPALTHASSMEATNKKQKRVQGGKGTEGVEKGKVTQSSHQPPVKEARTGKGQQKKTSLTRTAKDGGDPPKKPAIWRPLFTPSLGNPVLDDANLRNPQKGSSSLVAECLEKAFFLLEDKAELRSFKKREVFLALK